MLDFLIVGLGGALGAVLRHLISILPLQMESGFPVKTFFINIIGSFLIGLVAAWSEKNGLDSRLVLFLRVGICGGFTTFSSFALETHSLLSKGSVTTAVCYAVLSFGCGLLAILAAEKIV